MSKGMSIHKPTWVLIAFLLLLASCSSPGNPNAVQVGTKPPTRAVTVSPTATPTEPTPGPLPQNCPVSTPIFHRILPDLGPVIGTSPVWAEWPSGPSIFHLLPPSPYPSTYEPPYGRQALKVIWEVEPHYTHLITVRGYDLTDHTPLLLQFDDDTPTANAVLDPQQPSHPVSVIGDGWAEWGSNFVVSKAGCYSLEVSWPARHWAITFAVGA